MVVQADLVDTDPERFFRPPYVGHMGWLGVLLPGIDEIELAAICREAFTTVAPSSVAQDAGHGLGSTVRRSACGEPGRSSIPSQRKMAWKR